MPIMEHPAYKEEMERLAYTLGYVEANLEEMLQRKETLDESVSKGKKHFNSESSQQYIELMIGSMLQERTDVRLRNLLAARSKPYFARVDFQEDEKEQVEKLYIGKMALIRDEDQELIIVDWRAPVANLYYEERLGNAHYYSPDGDIHGKLGLKRQFSINEGKMEQMVDIDITTNDEFLQASLGGTADNRLKEIVSTIQTEQNRVIRADMWKPLIVQGAAGGGKTTIALHRIAYLIYTYEKSFKPENFMIIAPNKLFLNYISDILPELGVEKTRQTTYEEFAMQVIGQKFKIRDSNEKISLFVDHSGDRAVAERNEMIKRMSKLKCAMTFKDMLDAYIAYIESGYIPKEDFMLGNRVILGYDEINKLFLRDYRKHPIVKRLDEIKKHLTNRLKAQKQHLIEEIQSKCDKRIVQLKSRMEDTEERRKLIVESIEKKDEIIGKIETFSKDAVKKYINKITRIDPLQYYKDFIKDTGILEHCANGKLEPQLLDFLSRYTQGIFNEETVEIEDIAPIMYLKFKIYGVDEKIPVRHIVIDEAQDFSVFQIYTLKQIIKDSSFSILGDLSQGIHSYRGILDWQDLQDHVFEGRSEYLLLEQSYRTTVEIMDAANIVIAQLRNEKLVPAKPVIRHGEQVGLFKMHNDSDIIDDIAERMKILRNKGHKSMAVICKTAEGCSRLAEGFKKHKENLHVITGQEKEYKGGAVIVPSYLAKGLEFDAVFIPDGDMDIYTRDELDIKLLYVAMTRPLHSLTIYHKGQPTPLLDNCCAG